LLSKRKKFFSLEEIQGRLCAFVPEEGTLLLGEKDNSSGYQRGKSVVLFGRETQVG
jgi:hypothetical protein